MKMVCLSLCILIVLAGCSKKESEETLSATVATTSSEANTQESMGYDIRQKELEDNGSGVRNPQSEFRERFSGNNNTDTGDYLLEETAPIFDEDEQEYMDRWASEELTAEFVKEMYEAGFTGMDKDGDGLTDYDEITKYHSDPNKASTSGDLYSDGYKVANNMDISKQYNVEWKDIDDKFSILPESEYAALLSVYWVTEDYQDVEGMTLLDVGMEFCGDVKYAYEGNLDDLVVEVFNVWDDTYAPVDYTIEDGKVKFHVNEGYDKYLLHSKNVEVSFATLASE